MTAQQANDCGEWGSAVSAYALRVTQELRARAETSDAGSHAVHLAELAAAQRANADMLAAAVADASTAGLTWQAIGEALGVPKETVFRQHKAGSPVSVLRPFQSARSPRAGGAA